ncbi:hypothetical protein [Neobacillus vireti]|uniref:Uncharacterized protein n=1 Tax=Neobacillus vireti LMG 21834 TaxID=1131730 RepID=A0AB94IMW9_9BACI|nr:hypothetical protein [Neobacillus vireti]ETI68352.1 hypothetical protein BAVI_12804 [Neobacillus vireti LMG 21834]KLT16306.1 hypothetical protein AA980_17560 [Neobacillus vireti]
MSSKSLFRFSGNVLLLGALLNLVAAIWSFFVNSNFPSASASELQNPQWVVFNIIGFVAYALILIGLPGLYLHQSGGRGGKVGLMGSLFIALSTFFRIGVAAYFIAVVPILAEKAPKMIEETVFSGFVLFPFGAFFFGLIGFILLGTSIIRAKVFPTYVAILLIISSVIEVSGIFIDGATASAVILVLIALTMGIALGVIGLRLKSN